MFNEREIVMKIKVFSALVAIVTGFSLLTTNAFGWSEYENEGEDQVIYHVRGVGDTSCQDFLTELTKGPEGNAMAYEDWVDGYLSANSALVPETGVMDSKDNYTVMWWLGQYCKKRPEEKFSDAVKTMISHLVPAQDRYEAPKKFKDVKEL